jgi:three-Cys-motif partner protein
VRVYHGDCNEILLTQVFPDCRYEDYRRALCLLDPYGLQLDWHVVAEAGRMRSVEVFINFPIVAMNRNVLRQPSKPVSKANLDKMTRFWGDDSWRDAGYHKSATLFGLQDEKSESFELANAYRTRLEKVAGFSFVPKPMLMKNTKNGRLYYLFFASQKHAASHIIEGIFEKYRRKGYR